MKYLPRTICVAIFLSAACNSGSGPDNNMDSTKNKNDSAAADHTSTSMSKDTTNLVIVNLDKGDSDFASKAAMGGMAEVAMGRIAESNAKSQRVKNFGAMMVEDHSQGGDKLKQIASQKNIILPTSLSSDDQKHLDELRKKSGD